MAYGIDREGIARHIPDHAAAPIYGLVPPALPGYGDGRSSLPFNLATAQSEFRKCGPRRTPLKLVYAVDPAEGNGVYTTIVDQLRRIGFDASPNPVTSGYIGCWCGCMDLPLDHCGTQLARSSWRPDFPDPQSFVTRLLRCGQDENIGSWCNPTFDRLVDQADVEQKPAQRARLYFQAQRLALSRGARIPLIEMYAHELIKRYVHGLVGSEVSPELLPKDGDWSRVSVAGH